MSVKVQLKKQSISNEIRLNIIICDGTKMFHAKNE